MNCTWHDLLLARLQVLNYS